MPHADDTPDTDDATGTTAGRSLLRSVAVWSARLAWLLIGAGIGVAVAALVDPRTGPDRRQDLRERAGTAARRGAGRVRGRADGAVRTAAGAAVGVAAQLIPGRDGSEGPLSAGS